MLANLMLFTQLAIFQHWLIGHVIKVVRLITFYYTGIKHIFGIIAKWEARQLIMLHGDLAFVCIVSSTRGM